LSDIDNWLCDLHTMNPDQAHEADATVTSEHKLDLFATVMPAIDRGDKTAYSKWTPEQQASIEPWILMRWVSSAASDRDQPLALLTVNDFVNHNFSALSPRKSQGMSGHKHLQWMLLCLCGTGRTVRRKFMKPPRGIKQNKLEQAVLRFFPSMKTSDLEMFISINTDADLTQFFVDNGMSDADIADIFKSSPRGK
jgi:hypothetical protein